MNYEQMLENMTEEEIQQLLATDFGPELEKEASAELAQSELADALYTYGAFLADSEVASFEELSKEASEEYDAAAQEIAGMLEAALAESGLLETDDTAELHKEAQAAAAIIFNGYSDQIEKIAKAKQGWYGSSMKWLKGKYNKVKGSKAAKFVTQKHPGKAGLLTGAVVGAAGMHGAHSYRKNHEKRASDMTASELASIVREEEMLDYLINDGLEKLAKAGAKKGMLASAKRHLGNASKWVKGKYNKAMDSKAAKYVTKKHPGKFGFGAGMALGAGGMAGYHKYQEGQK